MTYNPNIHHRKSIRLKGYDYSQAGLYFITICCQRRGNPSWLPFGHIENNAMQLNDAGKMIETEWLALMERFTNIALQEFVVMPNHFHGILQIVGASLVDAQNNTDAQNDNNLNGQPQGIAPTGVARTQNDMDAQNTDVNRATTRVAPTTKKIGDMMDAFKSITTLKYINGVKMLGWQKFDGKLWQRNYYEHIIRNEHSYQTIANYIINNPAKWQEDKFYTI